MLKTMQTAAAAVATFLLASAADAAQFDGLIFPNSGGQPVPAATYDFGGGVTLGLAGLRNAEVGDSISLSILNGLASITSGSFLGFYVGNASIFVETVNPRPDHRHSSAGAVGTLFDSIYVTYDSNVVAQTASGGTTTFGTQVRLADLPEAFDTDAAPIPLPAALPMLAAALGGMGFVARRRKAA